MMKEKYIVVDIDLEGNVHAETFQMEGADCVEEIHKLMKDIATLSLDEKKPEYYKSKVETQVKQVINK